MSLFARYREAVGRDRVEVDVPDGATVEDVWRNLAAAHPVLARYRPHTLFAVGNEYVSTDRAVQPGEELACFPPVSGGSDRQAPDHTAALGVLSRPRPGRSERGLRPRTLVGGGLGGGQSAPPTSDVPPHR